MRSTTQRILDAVREVRSEMGEFTKTLVAIPTENPPGRDYRACVDAIAAKLSEMGLPSRIEEIPGTARGSVPADAEAADVHPRYWLRSTYGEGSRALFCHTLRTAIFLAAVLRT